MCVFARFFKLESVSWAAAGFFSRGEQIRGIGRNFPRGGHEWSPGGDLGAKPPEADDRL